MTIGEGQEQSQETMNLISINGLGRTAEPAQMALKKQMSKIMLNHRDEILISHRIKTLEKIFNDIIKK